MIIFKIIRWEHIWILEWNWKSLRFGQTEISLLEFIFSAEWVHIVKVGSITSINYPPEKFHFHDWAFLADLWFLFKEIKLKILKSFPKRSVNFSQDGAVDLFSILFYHLNEENDWIILGIFLSIYFGELPNTYFVIPPRITNSKWNQESWNFQWDKAKHFQSHSKITE